MYSYIHGLQDKEEDFIDPDCSEIHEEMDKVDEEIARQWDELESKLKQAQDLTENSEAKNILTEILKQFEKPESDESIGISIELDLKDF